MAYEICELCLFTAGEFRGCFVPDPDLGLFTAGEFGCEVLETSELVEVGVRTTLVEEEEVETCLGPVGGDVRSSLDSQESVRTTILVEATRARTTLVVEEDVSA